LSVATKRITSIDVANLAGVSVAAVSRAFTPGASIAPATKKRVLEAASTLGYQPNVIARSLNKRSSQLVGLLMSGWNNFGYVDVLRLLSERLEAHGYEVMLKSVLDREKIGEYVGQMLQYQVAALVVVSEVLPAAVAADCTLRGLPTVLVNRIGRGTGSCAVSVDGTNLGNSIADFLIERRHRRIALLRGRADIDYVDDVMNAIKERTATSGSCEVIADLDGVLGYEAGRRCISELFSRAETPDGVFCSYDHTAIGVMDGARIDLGLSIPEDLSVIGNGDRAPASWGAHELTTVGYPRDEVVEKAVHILLSRLEDPDLEPETALLKTDLVIRASTREKSV
jgi:DNA-binding LacI/PurR family transcriptional regulator